jgi:NADPH:quinone reductase-like Zn-dependent oxidoreductase
VCDSIDLKIRSGAMDGVFAARFPVLPGWDVAGLVEAAGAGAGAASGTWASRQARRW